MSARASVILITVDCLRADHVGFMGYRRPTTPFLDSIAGDSFVFPRAIVAGAPTYYSFPGIMASRFPLALGRDVVGLAPGEPTLASVLRNHGFRTCAFVAANPYLSRRFGYHHGFEVFEDFLSVDAAQQSHIENSTSGMRTRINEAIAKLTRGVGPLKRLYDDLYFEYCQRVASTRQTSWDELRRYPSADILVSRACAWIESLRDERFFLWLHFMDPHGPYCPPAEALHNMGTEISAVQGRYLNAAWNRSDLDPARLQKYREQIVQLHDGGVRWVDEQVERLVEFLRRSLRWDSSTFVLTADHGEEFLDHRSRFHSPARLYQALLHVPLLMRVPGAKPVRLSSAPFSHIHLSPTILNAIGIDPPAEFHGSSYWAEMRKGGGWDLAIAESVGACTNPMDTAKRVGHRVMAVQDEKYKLMIDFESGDELFFDLETDPAELRPVGLEAEKQPCGRLLRAAQKYLHGQPTQCSTQALAARIREIRLEWSHSKQKFRSSGILSH